MRFIFIKRKDHTFTYCATHLNFSMLNELALANILFQYYHDIEKNTEVVLHLGTTW